MIESLVVVGLRTAAIYTQDNIHIAVSVMLCHSSAVLTNVQQLSALLEVLHSAKRISQPAR
jgi:hypothetical protein